MLDCLLSIVIILIATLSGCRQPEPAITGSEVIPLVRAHAHNDYRHKRPLFDALDQGFCSVEADIHLVQGQLLVAHDRWEVKPDRTLETLYLEPLQQRIKTNNGTVYPNGPTAFYLLVDIKSESEPTYYTLHQLLKKYKDILCVYQNGSFIPGPVQVIISGNRPYDIMKAQALRYAGYDGRIENLKQNEPTDFMPWISDHFSRITHWEGRGPMPDDDRQRLRTIIQQAHQTHKRVRFWAVPHSENVWQELLDADIDYINTDQLYRLRNFLLQQNQAAASSISS